MAQFDPKMAHYDYTWRASRRVSYRWGLSALIGVGAAVGMWQQTSYSLPSVVGGMFLLLTGALVGLAFFIQRRLSKNRHLFASRMKAMIRLHGLHYLAWFAAHNLAYGTVALISASLLLWVFGPGDVTLSVCAAAFSCAAYGVSGLIGLRRAAPLSICWRGFDFDALNGYWPKGAAAVSLRERFRLALVQDQVTHTYLANQILAALAQADSGGQEIDIRGKVPISRFMMDESFARLRVFPVLYFITLVVALPLIVALNTIYDSDSKVLSIEASASGEVITANMPPGQSPDISSADQGQPQQDTSQAGQGGQPSSGGEQDQQNTSQSGQGGQPSSGGEQDQQDASQSGQGGQPSSGGGQSQQDTSQAGQGGQPSSGGEQDQQNTSQSGQGGQPSSGGEQDQQDASQAGQGGQPSSGGEQDQQDASQAGQDGQPSSGGEQDQQDASQAGQGGQPSSGGEQGQQNTSQSGQGGQPSSGGEQGQQDTSQAGQGGQPSSGGEQGQQDTSQSGQGGQPSSGGEQGQSDQATGANPATEQTQPAPDGPGGSSHPSGGGTGYGLGPSTPITEGGEAPAESAGDGNGTGGESEGMVEIDVPPMHPAGEEAEPQIEPTPTSTESAADEGAGPAVPEFSITEQQDLANPATRRIIQRIPNWIIGLLFQRGQ